MIPAHSAANDRKTKVIAESGKPDPERTAWLPTLVLIVGLGARLYKAAAYFLNPDEALHLVLTSQPSVKLAYKAALTNAHPPLLVLFLHYWRWFGQSEFVLRLPLVLAGTACCWVAYLWLKQLLGYQPAFVGLLLLAFSPAFIDLSAEIRQYALLLFFISVCLYLAERALREGSVLLMVLFSLSLCGALLIHYSALLFAFTMGIYMSVRFYGMRDWQRSTSGPKPQTEKGGPDRNAEAPQRTEAKNDQGRANAMRVFIVWAAGQLVALAIASYFLFAHLIPLRRAGMLVPDYDTYLRKSIFHPGERNVIGFVAVQTLRVFTYLFSHGLVGSLAMLAFMIGIILLLWGKVGLRDGSSPRVFALLLGLGFAVNCAAALAGQYPYGGTRHSAWLLLFAVASVCVGIASWARSRFWLTSGVVTCALVVANIFPAPAPLIRPKNQARALMKEAVNSFRESAPPGSLALADYQSGLLFGYYVCGKTVVQVVPPMEELRRYDCAPYTVVTPSTQHFRFDGRDVADEIGKTAAQYQLRPGAKIWFFNAGWITDSAPELIPQLRNFSCSEPKWFGGNIFWCQLAVGAQPEN